MKKVIIFIAIVVLAVIVYNQLTGSSPSSPDEQKVEHLSNDFRRVRKQFNEANSGAALGGVDISDEIDKVYGEVARIDAELRALQGQLTSETARKKAEKLRINIDSFKKSLTK